MHKNSELILNRLKFYLTGLLLFVSFGVNAQNVLIGAGGGVGTFAMNSMKTFNQSIVSSLPFKPLLTQNFPPYFSYKQEMIFLGRRNLAIGVNLTTTSTCSRLSLADYSGNYRFDNIQKGTFQGIKLLFGKAPGRINGFNISIEGGVAFSNMKIEEELHVYSDSTKDSNEFTALGFFFQPGICYFRNITEHLKLAANISYYYGFQKAYHLPNDKSQQIYNQQTGDVLKPQWDGLRIGITAYWCFRKK